MPLKTPSFWYRKETAPPPPLERLLSPLSALYYGVHKIHQSVCSATYKSKIPVICVGNITAGGSGKTPTALGIVTALKAQGLAQRPCFLTRGYGGDASGPLRVNPTQHTARDVGDEALLLARAAPTIISANRAAGAKLAEQEGMDVIVMDDGLQNPTLHKDLNLVVIDGANAFGNAKLIPAGPLREPLTAGIEKANAFILIGEDIRNVQNTLPDNKPLIHGVLSPASLPPTTQSYLAFAGLGTPEKFFDFLTSRTKLNIVKTKVFADHHPYTENDLMSLQQEATALNAHLITTEKDAVRLPEIENIDVLTLPVEMQWKNEDDLYRLLQLCMGGHLQ